MMKKSRKIIVMVVVVVLMLAVASTAFASSMTFEWYPVYGGPSQAIVTLARQRSYNIEQRVDGVAWNGQGSWKVRGYSQATGSSCTGITSLTGTGNFLADFTSKPVNVTVKNSIASSDPSRYLEWSGIVYS